MDLDNVSIELFGCITKIREGDGDIIVFEYIVDGIRILLYFDHTDKFDILLITVFGIKFPTFYREIDFQEFLDLTRPGLSDSEKMFLILKYSS